MTLLKIFSLVALLGSLSAYADIPIPDGQLQDYVQAATAALLQMNGQCSVVSSKVPTTKLDVSSLATSLQEALDKANGDQIFSGTISNSAQTVLSFTIGTGNYQNQTPMQSVLKLTMSADYNSITKVEVSDQYSEMYLNSSTKPKWITLAESVCL